MSVPDENALPWMTTDYGYVWTGYDECTEEDIAKAEAAREGTIAAGTPFVYDKLSLPGRLAREYTAEIWERGETTTAKMGGEGSITYEVQKVDSHPYGANDVGFKDADQDEIWHYHEGERVRGKIDYPTTGRSFHQVADDSGMSTHSGPRPGTKAYKKLYKVPGSKYVWNPKKAWWNVLRPQ